MESSCITQNLGHQMSRTSNEQFTSLPVFVFAVTLGTSEQLLLRLHLGMMGYEK